MKIYYIIQHLYRTTEDGVCLYWNGRSANRWAEWSDASVYISEDEAIRESPEGVDFTIIKCYIKS